MRVDIDLKIGSAVRLKAAGERIAERIIKQGFFGDIEMVAVLQALLEATGANVTEIYNSAKR